MFVVFWALELNSFLKKNISIYIHWPFCISKCPYCDFNSHVRNQYGEDNWKSSIISEIKNYRILIGERSLKTIFFGGGTPSLMHAETVKQIINASFEIWECSEKIEITLEANPNSVEVEKFENLSKSGVNRISIGVQSLVQNRLQQLGRKHSVEEAKKSILIAQNYFERVSFDLIYATPNQTTNQWSEELEEALNFNTNHISLYQLTIEPNTLFHKLHARSELILPPDNLAADLYELSEKICAKKNLYAYEVSNYAQSGFECLHNLNYWNYGEYIGVGAGAHGRVIIGGKKFATTQWKIPEKWINSNEKNEEKLELSFEEQEEERIMMGLRTTTGIIWNKPIHNNLKALIEGGFLVFEKGYLKATQKGRLALQSVLGYLLA